MVLDLKDYDLYLRPGYTEKVEKLQMLSRIIE